MKFKQKMLLLFGVSLLVFAVFSLAFGVAQYRDGMYEQTKSSLKSSALAALNLYNSQGYGDYELKKDGDVWRGMNFDVSTENSVVDDFKEQTGVDITFFYHDTAAMTSITNDKKERWCGMKTGENIKKYTLEKGAQLWYRQIEIDNKMCHAYIIPITQPGDGTVVGAMMASIPTTELNNRIMQYVLTTVAVSLVVLLCVGIIIFWYIGGLTKVLHDVRRVLSKVSNGDLSDDRLSHSKKRKDEFGELSKSTEKLRVKIYNILDEMQQGTDRLMDVVNHLNITSEKTTNAANAMDSSVGEISSTAANQQTDTQNAENDVNATKLAIEELLKSVSGINEISNTMSNLSQESYEILNGLQKSSENTQDTVTKIRQQTDVTNESVREIQNITEYITNIADETNLLALNASIEAARAGEAGRGFAVVAEQIQKLAEESNNSAAKIGQNIHSLVEKINGTLQAIQLVEAALVEQTERVSQTQDMFRKLNESIVDVNNKESDMQQNISSMNDAKDNMSAIIAELAGSASTNVAVSENASDATRQMMTEIRGINTLTQDLTDLAESLNENIRSFLS